jgi:DNA-binding transcriptional regulator YdaS (Cro superfamily)
MAALTWKAHLARAVAILGSQHKLAAEMTRCGPGSYSQAKISWLLLTADQISADDALAVHRATDGLVNASDLRPDYWTSPRHVPKKQKRVAA